jgi:Zn-finger nucleic acid-binding protein
MRCLVACAACQRQFDATGHAAGSRFHCACGAVVEVPRFRPQDASVVRCSACGAPRAEGAAACAHCGADPTLHERDLHTICPSCMTRISDRARYCHHCATPIAVQGNVGSPTEFGCPVCRRTKLNARTLGDPPLALAECPACAGLWLDAETFGVLADRAREASLDDPALARQEGEPAGTPAGAAGSFYRACPECRRMMNRRNFGQRSGVVVDACKAHGLWFDARELEQVLCWIRQGGEERAREREAQAARHAEGMARIKIERPTPAEGQHGATIGGDRGQGEPLGALLGLLFDVCEALSSRGRPRAPRG